MVQMQSKWLRRRKREVNSLKANVAERSPLGYYLRLGVLLRHHTPLTCPVEPSVVANDLLVGFSIPFVLCGLHVGV